MKIFVTGGTGFIGHSLIKSLLALKHEVWVLSRNTAKARKILGNQVNIVNNLSDIDTSTKIEAVINLAGEPIADRRWTAKQKKRIESSRIDLTTDLIAFMRSLQIPPKTLISGSAIGYYGEGGDNVLTEHTDPHDEFTHRLCASWEMQALRAKAYDIRVAILRTGLVIGRNGGFLNKMLPAFKLGLGAQLGDGKQWMSWIHLSDYVNIILYLLENDDQDGIYNATAPNPATNQEFSDTLASVLKRPRFLRIPASFLQVLLGEMSQLLTTSQRVIPEKLEKTGFTFQFATLRSALEDSCK
ncbi:MAG TPA: TIGR01777 family protein [Gammaproteobacteria bacterium]|nr:TIGR01777 family protein [Gammaproteobacteria bacterium]